MYFCHDLHSLCSRIYQILFYTLLIVLLNIFVKVLFYSWNNWSGSCILWYNGLSFLSQQVRIAVFSQHHVDGLDLSSNPLLYMMRCFPVSYCTLLFLFALHLCIYGYMRAPCGKQSVVSSSYGSHNLLLSWISEYHCSKNIM